jgi:endonuclease YncB( thermonuclease family)
MRWPFAHLPTRQAGLLHVTVFVSSFLINGVLTSLAVAEGVEGAIITGRTKAKDGDSVLIGFGRGTIDARLHGIDAPEFDQECKDQDGKAWRCGTDAAKALAGLVDGRQLRCEVTDLEKSGARRPIVRCFDGVINISAEMIRQGMAWAFDRYLETFDDHQALKQLEAEARERGVGIWRGEAEPAWKFRERRWERYASRAPNGCPIIGNEKSRIYYTPWSQGYSRMFEELLANPQAKGKRWFCTDADAVAAGFRPRR